MKDKAAFGIIIMMCIAWAVISIYKAIRWKLDSNVRKQNMYTFTFYYYGGFLGIANLIFTSYIPFMFLCFAGMCLGRWL